MSELDKIKSAARAAGCPEGTDVAEWLINAVFPAMSLQPSRDALLSIKEAAARALQSIADVASDGEVRMLATDALEQMNATTMAAMGRFNARYQVVKQDAVQLLYMDEGSPIVFDPARAHASAFRATESQTALIVKLSAMEPTAAQLDAIGKALRAVHGSIALFHQGVTNRDAALLGLTADELASIEPITDRVFKQTDGAAGEVQ
ncbi:hypothetical protein G3O06_23585 [Burkholderia sp. Ac-20345]|uniref:hypothetical protein n=1 Tax=Burkholderia sp. Ac-20345 TaxID=2703891 RepID=UPI00197BE8BD|nr:hypothetical protein [Burkholderia sp. Ac-20345]MBN3780500.1 hypothetical protein [Burkholderia sp. Ac-20345]